jgi:3-dehydroquinate dehydratase-2
LNLKKFLIINGPNLNLLGKREVEIYGQKSLEEIQSWTIEELKKKNILCELVWKQSNSEAQIIDLIQELHKTNKFDGLIINPGGLSHTSVSILDALLAIKPLPILEVHLSNPCAREEFRRSMLTGKAATMIMSGLGDRVYFHAAYALVEFLSA